MSDKFILIGFSALSYIVAFIIKIIYCRKKWKAPGNDPHNTPYNGFFLLATALLILAISFPS